MEGLKPNNNINDGKTLTSNIEAATLVEQYPEMAIIPVKEPKYPTPLAWLTPLVLAMYYHLT